MKTTAYVAVITAALLAAVLSAPARAQFTTCVWPNRCTKLAPVLIIGPCPLGQLCLAR